MTYDRRMQSYYLLIFKCIDIENKFIRNKLKDFIYIICNKDTLKIQKLNYFLSFVLIQ